MTSKLVVNTIEADTGISSVSFASSISMSSTSKFHFSDAGIDIGADTNINRPATGVIGFNINSGEKVRIESGGDVSIGGMDANTFSNYRTLTIGGAGAVDGAGIDLERSDGNIYGRFFGDANGVQIQAAQSGDSIRFETNGANERLRIDSAGRVMIGTTTEGFASYGDKFTIADSGHCGMTIRSGSSNYGTIYFSDGDDGSAAEVRGFLEYYHSTNALSLGADGATRLRIASNGDFGFNDTAPTANASGNDTVLSIKGKGSSYSGKIDFKDSSGNIDNHIASDNSIFMFNCDPNSQNGNTSMQFSVHGGERFRFGRHGQLGIAGANYGAARQVMVSNGSGSAVSWSSNPLLLDMDSLGDIDYDGVFLRYRETATVTGNGLIYLGLCKSTTNCPAGRIGIPVGFIPSTVYNGHFRVDKVGITPWPDGSGHRYEYYAIISDYVSSGKLGVFYLTNSTN